MRNILILHLIKFVRRLGKSTRKMNIKKLPSKLENLNTFLSRGLVKLLLKRFVAVEYLNYFDYVYWGHPWQSFWTRQKCSRLKFHLKPCKKRNRKHHFCRKFRICISRLKTWKFRICINNIKTCCFYCYCCFMFSLEQMKWRLGREEVKEKFQIQHR